MQLGGVAPGVAPEQPDGAAVGAEQAEEDPDGGGLARPVGAEEAVDLALVHGEVEPVEGGGGAEPLDEAGGLDDWSSWLDGTSFSENSESY